MPLLHLMHHVLLVFAILWWHQPQRFPPWFLVFYQGFCFFFAFSRAPWLRELQVLEMLILLVLLAIVVHGVAAAVALLFIRVDRTNSIPCHSIHSISNISSSSAWAMAVFLALIIVPAILAKVMHWQWQC